MSPRIQIVTPTEYLRWVNETYGAPKFQEEMHHRTRHNECGFPGCHVVNGLQLCSRCKIRQYCCRDHQQGDWKAHKQYCRAPVVDLPGPEVHQCPERYSHDLPHLGRAKLALKLAERLTEVLALDVYPSEDEELVFGIEMGTNQNTSTYVGIDFPVGNLMYNAWKFLYGAYIGFEAVKYDEDDDEACRKAFDNAKFLFLRRVAQSILAGELSIWFQRSVEFYRDKYLEEKLRADAYVEELRRREFKGIKWDNQFLEMLKIWPRPGDPELSPLSTDPLFWIG